MTRTNSPAPAAAQTLNEAFSRLLDGEALAPFASWFAQSMTAIERSQQAMSPDELAFSLRYQRFVARHLWGHMPMPSNRWRARGLPKLERNAPCHCGSGRKLKICCAEFEHGASPIDAEHLLVVALETADPKWLTGDSLRHAPAQALGMAALNWNDSGSSDKTVATLRPLFEEPTRLDARHEMAMDALLDALLNLGQDDQRRALLQKMAAHADKALATSARARLVSVLADRGEIEKSWALFHELSRFNPNDPQLWGLEMTLLLSQGRQEEARLRAPLLAARARRDGLSDLADSLMEMAQHGLASAYENHNDGVDDPEHLEWLALIKALPEAIDVAALQTLYQLDQADLEDDDGQPFAQVSLRPVKKMADLNTRWRRKFLVGKPEMVWLEGDVDCLLGSLPEALAFMQKNPTAWLSGEVLDDLLLAANELCQDDAPGPVLKAARRLAAYAVSVLMALVGSAQLHWAESHHRPFLRCLALAIELARMAHDEPTVLALLQQGLALNPHDNHGWRTILAPMLISDGQHSEALALMAKNPGDMPPSEHLRAMALFCSGQKPEAQTVLSAAHAAYPLYLNTLLPEAMEPPPEEPGPGLQLGGAMAAWYLRLEWRALWVRCGALAWARALKLPEPPPPALPKAPATSGKAGKASKAGDKKRNLLGMQAPSEADIQKAYQLLQKTCSAFARLHGFLAAVAWSPQIMMPNAWLQPAFNMLDRMPKSRTEATANKAMSSALQALMLTYNQLNQNVIDGLNASLPPLVEILREAGPSDEAVFSWANGFLQGCELAAASWARKGHKVTGNAGTFGALRRLASRAVAVDPKTRIEQADGLPLLLALNGYDPAPQLVLAQALTALWPAVAASRLAGNA